ncbi:uncharacterized protein C8orf48 homolog isoform X1 [Pelobates fuscus]|uniref:uncharacterized protein C8orf48 homolog isoform X1 n=1 Tax=Pelobates fuscus TaxID=191477 RepID=UPI002FE49ECF
MEYFSEIENSSNDEESIQHSSLVSSGSGYSKDSFESVTDGSNFSYESETFESLSSDTESDPVSPSETSGQSRINGDSPEEQSLGEGLIEKWIKTLKHQELRITVFQSGFHRTNVAVADKKSSALKMVSKEERNALAAFCIKKIRNIQHPSVKLQDQSHPATHPKRAVVEDCKCPIQLFNRVWLKNTMETMKQLNRIDMHQPSTCPHCCAKHAELAKSEFLRKRKTKLESLILEKKIEEFVFNKDAVTLIGEIHQSLPRLSDERNIIWQRLFCSGEKTWKTLSSPSQ